MAKNMSIMELSSRFLLDIIRTIEGSTMSSTHFLFKIVTYYNGLGTATVASTGQKTPWRLKIDRFGVGELPQIKIYN